MSTNTSDLPVLDISGGVDPLNNQWRTDNTLYLLLCDRYTAMSSFMKALGVEKMSTHLNYKGIEFKILMDNNK